MIAEAIRACDPALVTFDLFDTLVFRKVDRPVDAFALVGRRLRELDLLSAAVTPAMFGALRAEVEDLARSHREARDGSREVDLPAIYDAFPRWPLAPEATTEVLAANEVHVERSLLVADLDVVAFLEGVKDGGRRLAAVSDIYFPEQMLRELLQLPRLTALLEDMQLHVSCDLGFGKGSGLWSRTREVLGVPPEQIVHFGDNPVDDVEKARAAGVTAVAFPQRDEALEQIKTAERRLRETVARPQPLEYRNTIEPAGLYAMRGKVAAQADASPARRPYWLYGATILGPVLSGLAQWVAREAACAGMSRVGCLMREGTLLAQLVSSAGAAEGIALEAVPTWLNRHVGLAATLGGSDDPVERLLHGRSGLTVIEGLDLLGLALEDVPELAGQAQTRLLDPTVRTMFEQAVGERPDRREKAAAHARVVAGRAAQVLEAAADPTGRLWLVDLGWGASIQADAVDLLRRQGRELWVTGLYLVTNDSALSRVAAGLDVRSFLLDSGSGAGLVDLIMRSPEILEQVTCAAVGTQRGIDEQLQPVTAELDAATHEQRLDAEAVRAGVLAFHDTWTTYRGVVPESLPSLADAQADLLPVLLRSVIAPTIEEARLFGDWHHDEGRGSATEDPLAGIEHERLATHASGDQLQALPMRELYWPAGLVARYEPDHAPLVQAAASGLVPWKALSREVGQASFGVVDAAEVERRPHEVKRLRANQRGNVLLSWSHEGADLRELTVQLCQKPHVVRLDSLELRLWEQGSASARVVRLAAEDLVLQIPRQAYATIGHNVLVARAPGASLMMDLLMLRRQVVHRVQVLARFGLLSVPAPLGGRLALDDEIDRVVREMKESVSWRVTEPLRRAAGAGRWVRRTRG
ncbi:MAG: HAD family hydrolase [Solirubrobacteraceae bacterium]